MNRKIIRGFNRQQESENNNTSRNDNSLTFVIESYFESRQPGNAADDDNITMTTVEIADDLSDILPVPIAFLAKYMFEHGYKLKECADHQLRWLIKRTFDKDNPT